MIMGDNSNSTHSDRSTLSNIIKISRSDCIQDPLKGDNSKRKQWKATILAHKQICLDMKYSHTKHYQNISKSIEVKEST